MSLYEFLLFVHILAAATWFGAGFLLHIQGHRATAAADAADAAAPAATA